MTNVCLRLKNAMPHFNALNWRCSEHLRPVASGYTKEQEKGLAAQTTHPSNTVKSGQYNCPS